MNVSRLVNDSMSQRKLAKVVGVPQSTLSRWLSGKTPPDIYSALKIAEALGVRVEVLAGEEKPNPERDLLEEKIRKLGVREVLRRVLSSDDPPEDDQTSRGIGRTDFDSSKVTDVLEEPRRKGRQAKPAIQPDETQEIAPSESANTKRRRPR